MMTEAHNAPGPQSTYFRKAIPHKLPSPELALSNPSDTKCKQLHVKQKLTYKAAETNLLRRERERERDAALE